MELTLKTTGVLKPETILGVNGVKYPLVKTSKIFSEAYRLNIDGVVTNYTYKLNFNRHYFYANERQYNFIMGLNSCSIVIENLTFIFKKSQKKYRIFINDVEVAAYDEYSTLKSSFKLTTVVDAYYEYMLDLFIIYNIANNVLTSAPVITAL